MASSSPSSLRYRPEVDGLRALAVVPVIMFHAGVGMAQGGFVGVDVFFVISGYLITALILREQEDGSFSIRRFYERRARRILPALFTVLLCASIAGWFWLMPDELMYFAKSVVAVCAFGANMFFQRDLGYFDHAAAQAPLLHTWSLGVEEQFYLLFPLVLVLLGPSRRRSAMRLLTATAIASLVLAEWGAAAHPAAAFYLLPFRAWELLTGALVAMSFREAGDPTGGPSLRKEALAFVGVLLVVGSIVTLDAQSLFPGLHAAPAVVGTALILAFAAPHRGVGWLLAQKPLVRIGLMSYSAYLWHVPLFVFARLAASGEIPLVESWGLIALTIALAWATLHLIERPSRDTRRVRWRTLAPTLSLVAAGFVAMAAWTHAASGWPGRLPPRSLGWLAERSTDRAGCVNKFDRAALAADSACSGGRTGTAPSVALVGDSHAAALAAGLSWAGERDGWSMLVITGSYCIPLAGFESGRVYIDCEPMIEAALARIERTPSIRTVVLAAQWPTAAAGLPWAQDRRLEPAARGVAQRERFRGALSATVARLRARGLEVVIVHDVPDQPFDVPATLARAEWKRLSVEQVAGRSRAEFVASQAEAEAVLASVDGKVRWASPATLLCGPSSCRYRDARGDPLYGDASHLNARGSKLVSASIVAALAPGSAR